MLYDYLKTFVFFYLLPQSREQNKKDNYYLFICLRKCFRYLFIILWELFLSSLIISLFVSKNIFRLFVSQNAIWFLFIHWLFVSQKCYLLFFLS